MKENYFKSFFKTNGLLPTIIAILAFVFVGYASIYTKIVNKNLADIMTGIVLAGLAGMTIVGLSGLRNEKCGFLDLLRVVGFTASLVLAIITVVKGDHKLLVIGFFAIAGVAFLEVVLRFAFCKTFDENSSFKNYFGTLAGKYNPLIILIVGALVAFGMVLLFKTDAISSIESLKNYPAYRYVFAGGVLALVIVVIVMGLDKDTDVNILDFILSVLFVACAYLCVFITPAGLTNRIVPFLVIVLGLAIASVLLVRAILYNKGKGYTDPSHKIRTYFKSVYDEFDVTIPLFCSLVVILLVLIGAGKLYGDKRFVFNLVWKAAASDGAIMTLYVIALVIGVAGVVITLITRKFKEQSAVRTDDVLVGLLFTSTFVVLYGVIITVFTNNDFFGNTANLILFIGYAVIFVYAVIVQFIRLKKFEPIHAVITAAQRNEEEAPAQEEYVEETPEEEAVEEPVEEENNDPFALTEEDEALFNSYYGTPEEVNEEELEEEPVEEVVEEEVVEEEPVEEVVEEIVEEPAQEVVEEVVEEAAEDTAEDEEVEEDEEEEEAEEEVDEYEDGEEEVEAAPQEVHKEENIVVQDFQVLDENGEVRKIKRKFLTKMMFAPYETKEYYNEIKNYLGLYRAKGRQSARCESFRYKGLVAKVALGGKSVKVFLAIDPSFIDENPKYHLKDVSEKKQYVEVPVMMKVRSDRGLKYFKELVDYMFATRGVKPKRNYENVDYLPSLIPNGEAILATLGMSTYYLQDSMNAKGIPDEMPDNLQDYLPMIPGEALPEGEEEIEAAVYLDTLCNHFEDGNEVTIDVLKSLHIVTRGNVLRIKARGTLDRKLIIYAEYFDEDALKMLMCTNCTAVKVIR